MQTSPTLDLSLANIELAATAIDPVFRNSTQYIDDQLSAALGRRTLVKVETANPIRSFKGRGADFLLRSFAKQKVVCASAGNFGQAVAYAGRSRSIAVEVFVPTDVNPMKVARMEALGAQVTIRGTDFEAAKNHARDSARQQANTVFVEDGEDPAICEGAGTIAVELLRFGAIDTVVVPLGDGALITGIAMWIKAHSPETRIVGVCATGAPAMLQSWQAGRSIPTVKTDTIADGIAVSAPISKSVARIKALVDDIVLVDDSQLLEAMRLAASTLGLLLEPAGAAGLAAIRAHALPGDQFVTVLTGSNVHPDLLSRMFR